MIRKGTIRRDKHCQIWWDQLKGVVPEEHLPDLEGHQTIIRRSFEAGWDTATKIFLEVVRTYLDEKAKPDPPQKRERSDA